MRGKLEVSGFERVHVYVRDVLFYLQNINKLELLQEMDAFVFITCRENKPRTINHIKN